MVIPFLNAQIFWILMDDGHPWHRGHLQKMQLCYDERFRPWPKILPGGRGSGSVVGGDVTKPVAPWAGPWVSWGDGLHADIGRM